MVAQVTKEQAKVTVAQSAPRVRIVPRRCRFFWFYFFFSVVRHSQESAQPCSIGSGCCLKANDAKNMSLLSHFTSEWSKSQKYNHSHRIAPVYRLQSRAGVVDRSLRSNRCFPMRQKMNVAIVAKCVCLYAACGLFFEPARNRIFPEQQFRGAVHILHARPDVVILGKSQRRFEKIAVLDHVVCQ